MSQSELRNFEKSMAYHLAPAMLGDRKSVV